MDTKQCRVGWCRWTLALGALAVLFSGMIFFHHEIIAAAGVLGVMAVLLIFALRQWRAARFAALINGDERIAEWLDEDDRPVCIGEHAVYANDRFICWTGRSAFLKRAEYNPKRHIFKFVVLCPAAGFLPWRHKVSLKITVPPEAVDAAMEAEHFFEPRAENHRRHSVDPAPPQETEA